MLHDMNHPQTGFLLERNPSYWSSVRMGLSYGIWHAPATLLSSIAPPLKMILGCLGLIIARLLGWVVFCLLMIGMGLAGRITPIASSRGIHQD